MRRASSQGPSRTRRSNPVGATQAVIHEMSGLPPELYSSIWEGTVIAWGGTDVKVEYELGEGTETTYRVSWRQ